MNKNLFDLDIQVNNLNSYGYEDDIPSIKVCPSDGCPTNRTCFAQCNTLKYCAEP